MINLVKQYLLNNEDDTLSKVKKDISINPQKYFKDNKRCFTQDEVNYLKNLANHINQLIVSQYALITKPVLNEGDKLIYNDIEFTCVSVEEL